MNISLGNFLFEILISLSIFFVVICSSDIEVPYSLINYSTFELDSYYIINKIIFSQVSNNQYDYLLGIFEASNFTSFSDSLPIAIIKEENLDNSNGNEICININMPQPYKYIRYIKPNANSNSNITDIKIYGHILPTDENLSEKKLLKITNLPLIIIKTENAVEPISKVIYINSTITIINNNIIELNESALIRVRGQSTANRPKKPFKIKFGKKQNILGISGQYKKWTLLASHYDKTLIRTLLAFKISEIIGLEFTPRCEPVDVILNGNFRGSYYICDQIEVKEGRVDIEKISKDDISGGYLLEIDSRAKSEEKYFLTDKGILGEIKYPDPDDITESQEKYINQYLNTMESNVYEGNLDYIDLDSFYKYFLMQEFCGDIDTVFSSFHITKRKNDNKTYFGPVWDYDRAFDNDNRLYPTNNKSNFTLYYGDSAGTCRTFIITLINTKNVLKNINQTWFEIREEGLDIETLKDFIEEKVELLLESANLNMLKWYNSKIGKGKDDYLKNVKIVINYLEKRFESLTNLIYKNIKENEEKINNENINDKNFDENKSKSKSFHSNNEINLDINLFLLVFLFIL